MRVRMLTTAQGPAGTWMSGREYDLEEELAAAFVAVGSAERLEPPAAEAEAPDEEPESEGEPEAEAPDEEPEPKPRRR